MRGEQNLKEAIIQNLKDAGCNKKMIEEFLSLFSTNNKNEMLNLLAKYRRELLEKIHKNQKELDDLDYLIIELKNNNHKNI